MLYHEKKLLRLIINQSLNFTKIATTTTTNHKLKRRVHHRNIIIIVTAWAAKVFHHQEQNKKKSSINKIFGFNESSMKNTNLIQFERFIIYFAIYWLSLKEQKTTTTWYRSYPFLIEEMFKDDKQNEDINYFS